MLLQTTCPTIRLEPYSAWLNRRFKLAERLALMLMDIIKLGARARAVGRPRDACPYPGDSRERRAWFEGYDGSSWEMASRMPHPARLLPGMAAIDTGDGAAVSSAPQASA
ncbi:ribosome modulation factor [Methylobacterium sp. CM6257]